MNEAIQLIPVIVMAGLIVFLAVTNHTDRKQNRKREDDLITRLMSRDVIEYSQAAFQLKKQPDEPITAGERTISEAQDAFRENDRIPIG